MTFSLSIFLEQSSTYASGMSGLCQHGLGKKQKIESLWGHQNLCIHLEVFQEYMINSRHCPVSFFGFCSWSIR